VLNQIVKASFCTVGLILVASAASAQSVEQIRWKSESQVREILGEPQSTTPPVGTHAEYTLWTYDTFMVAFANSKAFHLFTPAGQQQYELNENREEEN